MVANSYPKHVWMYYDGELAPVLKTLVNRTRDILSSQWNFFFITPESLDKYISQRAFPRHFDKYASQAQSDWIRLELLAKYGGWWIDASTIINSDRFMEEIRNELITTQGVFYGFCFNQCPNMLIESSVLYSNRNSTLVRAWEFEYTTALQDGRESYIYNSYRAGIDLPFQLFKSYPFVNPYFTIYAAERVAISRKIPRKTVFLTRDANTLIYKLMTDCNWQRNCIVDKLHQELSNPAYQVTKLWSWWRLQAWPGSEAKTTTSSREPPFIYSGVQLPGRITILRSIWLFYQLLVQIQLYRIGTGYLNKNDLGIKSIFKLQHRKVS